MKKEKTYLLTYYLKNTDERTKAVFENIPYKTKEISLSEERLVKLIEAELKKYPYIRCCSVMSKEWFGQNDWELKFTVSNPFFLDEPIPYEIKPRDAEQIVINDSMNQVYMTKYEPSHEGFEVNLESEQKVIRLGSFFYDLKGVLICEATDEDRKKYYCDKFITFPIVDDDWRVFDGKEITDGIERLIVGKKGDTIPLAALREAADYNAREHDCEYEMQLQDLERHGITVSNRKTRDSAEELPENIVIGIDKLGEKRFRMDADWGSYYIPRRFFFVGEDDELYESDSDDGKPSAFNQKLLTRIVDDVWGLSWFFNKPKLRVLVTAVTDSGFGFQRSQLGPIPKDWFYTVQTLEGEINRKLDEMHQQYPDNYNRAKRSDIVEEKFTK